METPGTSRSFKEMCVSPVTSSVEWKEDQNPPHSVDDEQLLSIFPEEIWREILESVNPPDLESVNNASPFFRRLLYPDRTTFLFSSVWKLLGVQYEYDADPVYCDLELTNSDLNDARRKQREPVFSVILKLRLVCQEWRLAVDKFYEDLYSYDTEHSVHKARIESGLDSRDEERIKREYHDFYNHVHWNYSELVREEEVQAFMEHFMATHDNQKNPFSFRKVIFAPDFQFMWDDFIEYCSSVIQLLTKYGHHIWFCGIQITNEINSLVELWIKIQEMLTMMPNLKVLRLILLSFSDPEMTKCEEEEMKQALVAHPVPRFESLRMVSFQSTPKILMEHILETNDHVGKVDIKANIGLEGLDFTQVSLPNLTQLAVHLETTENFEQLEKCGPLWKLEMLHLEFSDDIADNIPLSRIFKCLEQWRNSLTDVVVCLLLRRVEPEVLQNSEMRLDLPSVKRLRIQMPNIQSLDFILPMRNSLELLEYTASWRAPGWETIPSEIREEMKKKAVIQFPSLPNDEMYKSNIWPLFPKLGQIHVCFYKYECDFNNELSYIRQKRMDLGDQ